MARLRYLKTMEQVAAAAANNPEFMKSSVRSIRAVYETDPALARAVVPQPLVPAENPQVCVTFSEVSIQISPDFTFDIGSAIFGIRVAYEGVDGTYLITMPMTTEGAVVGGRETYGEPKKIADIEFCWDGELGAKVSRMGMPYLEVKGRTVEDLGPREFTEYGYCYKAFPSCEQDKAFDTDPLLVRLEWRHEQTASARMEGELILHDSPLDPVADLPIRKLVKLEYEAGTTQSNGHVLRSVPGDWILPFLHQRYDDMALEGVEIAV